MVYHYTDGFLTVPKENAIKAWMNFDEVKIGYQNKAGGAYWTLNQFPEIKDTPCTRRKQFDLLLKKIKEQIPYSRIRYIIKESVYLEQVS